MKYIFSVIAILISFFSSIATGDMNEDAESGRITKNIIVMISDGCGYNHIDATSLYQYGEPGLQVYEKFPVQLGMSTYTVFGSYNPETAKRYFTYINEGATDSAAAATAMSTGSKTYNGAIGVNVDYAPLKNVVEYAEENGMATGVVTTVQFSHATPAGFVAHNFSRDNHIEIARDMIYQSALEVIMGCGAPDYDENGHKVDDLLSTEEVGGDATFLDLIDDARVSGADANNDGTPDDWTVIRSRQAFQNLAHGPTPSRVIGLPFVNETLQQKRGGDGFATPYEVPRLETVPTLSEMTQAALNVLDDDTDGFFLMIEGGAVDWAGHDNQSGRMIEEEIDFNKAVETVVSWVEDNSNWDETLLIVTGDHECGFLNGPGSSPSWNPMVNNGKGVQPGMQWYDDEHTNQLIPFFAKGVNAERFRSMVVGSDPFRGPYMDNTACGSVLIDILSKTSVCTPLKQARPYDHQACLDTIPDEIKGLEILSGPRSKKSIIQDMVPVACYGHVWIEKMKAGGEDINVGEVVFRVAVEYTGEVYQVEVVDCTIQSERFIRKLSDLIMDTDFAGWQRDDAADTVFIYPMSFIR